MIGEKLGPYEILESIGSGGMGEVWKARDTRLGRVVAIKKVKEQHSERFKQEARSIAALNHPNICQIHDIGPDYLVLEYVEGKPLSSPLPEPEAIRLAIQITTALEEAHRHGIIHRDLKPSNIMVTEVGSVKLLDFGLAKLYEDASISSLPTADMPSTQAGAILGTVAYMSPEQAQGQPADARSDIFSFGLVLYEMLSGKRAFTGESPVATALAVVKDEPPPIQISPSLERIVNQCLAKQPERRYQAVSEVRTALEKVGEKVTTSSSESQPSIAVLPFVNMSGDKEQEYFSDGLAEEIINALTKIPGLKVIARTSSFSFRAKDVDIGQIRDRLKVRNILEGSVRKSGNRIRVTAQLINTADESHLWSERYDRELTDVFAIQDEISQAITEKLKARFSGDRQAAKRPTENIEAYNLNLKGRYYRGKITPDNLAKSKECFEKAIALDPNYAEPWHGLAAIYGVSVTMGFSPPRPAIEQSRLLILKALELDNTLPEAHAHLAGISAIEFDWRGAEREFLRALELGPSIWDVGYLYSYHYLIPMRRLDEALATMRKAQELDPLSPVANAFLGYIYILLKQYDQAIELCRNALDLDPNSPIAYWSVGAAHIMKGEPDETIRIYDTIKPLLRSIPVLQGVLGTAYAVAGQISEAHRILEELHVAARNAYVPVWCFAEIYLGLGETEKAFDWFDKAVEERSPLTLASSAHFFFNYEHLRSHPRYKALRRKMNLEP